MKPAQAAQHGRYIFVYCNIRTNQVLYSLTRALNNNASIKQLTYAGKKTIPASLRKDTWQPMATISFPHPPQGLQAFRQLREYRRMHELAYPLEDIRDKEKNDPNALIEKKKRARIVMDQKANSIADIAAVLKKQEEAGPIYETAERPTPAGGSPSSTPQRSLKGWWKGKKAADGTGSSDASKPSGVKGVTVSWRNLFDAEYAESWPADVVHSVLSYKRHTPAVPVREAA